MDLNYSVRSYKYSTASCEDNPAEKLRFPYNLILFYYIFLKKLMRFYIFIYISFFFSFSFTLTLSCSFRSYFRIWSTYKLKDMDK